MVFPYRVPASVEPEPVTVRTRTLDRWVRAVSGAAVLFLVTATALMFTLARDIAENSARTRDLAAMHLTKSASREAAIKPHAPPAPRPPPRCAAPPPAEPRFLSPLGLASLGAPTHDPLALLARAARLRADGADLTLTRTMLPTSLDRSLEEAFAPHARIAARFAVGGIEIRSLPPGSTAALLGLQPGDVITAVNGHALIKPEEALAAYADAQSTRVVVIEVIRGEHRIVIEVRFQPAKPRQQSANHVP
jgi:hypothetical protein